MKKNILFIALLIVIASCCPTKDTATKPAVGSVGKIESYDLNSVVKTIQKQYECAITRLAEEEKIKDIEITDAELSLTVTKTTGGSAGLSVLVFEGSGGIERSKSTNVTFKLAKEDSSGGASSLAENDNELCDLIVASAKQFRVLKNSLGDLKKDSFDLTIGFSIEKTAGGKISFEIFGAGAELGAERTGAVEHEMTLTFKPSR